MRVAVVGCGLIGLKRARSLEDARLVAAADTVTSRAAKLAAEHPGCVALSDWREAVRRDDVDLVIVATTNDALAEVASAAIGAGKHVLLEKPGARTPEELEPLLDAARSHRVVVKVGFNHRFHPAFRKARELFDAGAVGPLLYIRARYGHGGRPGYDREWRADRAVAGGGELLDQGVHLIDLARSFAGEMTLTASHVATYFWDMPVEDNGFLLLRADSGQIAWLHASCTEWKNLFSFELFGREGKLQVSGLGGSYGVESLAFYRMLPRMGPPETTIWEYPGEDDSWREEWRHLVACIESGSVPRGGLEDALAALRIVHQAYRA